MADEERPELKVPEKRVSDIVPEGLWPDIAQCLLQDTLDMDIVIHDCAFLLGENGPFAVILYQAIPSGDYYTTACGGQVVVRKLHDLKDGGHLPVLGMITKPARYYDLT